jgi:hypothetical protein
MADNVILFGAGASFDAGVPLLGNFIEKMKGYALRGMDDKRQPLSESDIQVFKKAWNAIYSLNEYHARAAFDDRNLEDLLSILSFSTLGQDNADRAKLDALIDAIVRTIELSCTVVHDDINPTYHSEYETDLYVIFWRLLFREWKTRKTNPVLISLNYDLVLERSLFNSLTRKLIDNPAFSFDGVVLDYKYSYSPRISYKIAVKELEREFVDQYGFQTSLVPCNEDQLEKPFVLEILKLHGSLNFPSNLTQNTVSTPISSVEKPLIVPPITNKLINDDMTSVWNSAFNHLREVKNLIIVGYSLPRSDVYMQFFLKSALGPNKDFDKLLVFDPLLFQVNNDAKEMKQRYASCFSEQLRNYIIDKPDLIATPSMHAGTFRHFVDVLDRNPDYLFF